MGLKNGTAFIDISYPINPIYLGKLPTHTGESIWRDIKVYQNHAFIVSEASNHGMQVFDLTRLRNVPNPPENFTEDAHYYLHKFLFRYSRYRDHYNFLYAHREYIHQQNIRLLQLGLRGLKYQ